MINLGVNGVKVLRAVDPDGTLSERLESAAQGDVDGAVWDLSGAEVRRISTRELDAAARTAFGAAGVRLAWYDLQRTLRQRLEEISPGDQAAVSDDGTAVVRTGCRFDGYDEDAAGVTVRLCVAPPAGTAPDAVPTECRVRCRLLVGADGVYSQVRRRLTGGAGCLENTGKVIFRGASRVDEWEGPPGALASLTRRGGAPDWEEGGGASALADPAAGPGLDSSTAVDDASADDGKPALVYTMGGPAGASLHSVVGGLVLINAVFDASAVGAAGFDVAYDDTGLVARLVARAGGDAASGIPGLDTKTGGPDACKVALLRCLAPFHAAARDVVRGIPGSSPGGSRGVTLHADHICLDPSSAAWQSRAPGPAPLIMAGPLDTVDDDEARAAAAADDARPTGAGGRVVLVGDAAHAFGVSGVGIGLGMEDGHVLAAAVASEGPGARAAAAYVRMRRPRVAELFAMLCESRGRPPPQADEAGDFLRPTSPSGGNTGGGGAGAAGATVGVVGTGGPVVPRPSPGLRDGPGGGGPGGPRGGPPPEAVRAQMFEVAANRFLAEADWAPLGEGVAAVALAAGGG